ncbi:hypothetical protein [Orenia marismortui]|uniref:hypothetical protein n=1 Tax=Orenia marismortui TaxID=46469 RepID=UPI00035FA0CD|nr:hypothetical protein [Orenia marismortui]
MKLIKNTVLLLVVGLFLIIFSGVSAASTLNLGEEVYKFKMTNVNSNDGDYMQFNLGYGLNKYSGYGLSIVAPYNKDDNQAQDDTQDTGQTNQSAQESEDSKSSFVELEYQFIPESKQDERKEFNYAFKIGGVSGHVFDGSDAGVKAGFIIEKEFEDKLFYFDGDIISASTMLVDGEFGVCGEIGEGILGIIGFKAIVSDDEELDVVRGVNYGIRVDF